MQIKTFSIPIHDAAESEAVMNAFLRGHRILQTERRFVEMGPSSCWAIYVEYMESTPSSAAKSVGKGIGKTGRIDYKAILSPVAFALFAKLRELRKQIAEQSGVPVFAVFTNEQLAAMVDPVAGTTADLLKIEGVGQAKVEKYGPAVLELLKHETSQPTANEDRRTGEPEGGLSQGEPGQAGESGGN